MEERPKLRYFDVIPDKRGFIVVDPFSISKEMFFSRESFLLLTLIDGKRTISDIKSEFLKMTGIILSNFEIASFINELDRNYLLYNERFFKKINEEKEKMKSLEFKEIKINNRLKELTKFLKDKNLEITKKIKGMIIPHIDIFVAKETYQKVFAFLKNVREKVIVIFGVPHFWFEIPFSLFPKNFKVEEKIIETDINFLEKIKEKFDYDITSDYFSFKREHSIEFPLIFISFLEEDKKVLAFLVSESNKEKLREIAKKLLEVIKEFEGEFFFISSIDLSHVGKKFGDEKSFDPEEIDIKYIDYLLNLENEKAFDFLEKNENITKIDGKNTNFLFLEILKNLDIKRGTLIDYKKYYEELTDSLVSYSLIVFE
ncbi:MAG: AmmeMemoRadiSam system protein B [candidate division WOR-3 bacterium]